MKFVKAIAVMYWDNVNYHYIVRYYLDGKKKMTEQTILTMFQMDNWTYLFIFYNNLFVCDISSSGIIS